MTKVTLLSKKDLETEILKKLECQGTDFASNSQYTSYWTSTPSGFNYWGAAREFDVTRVGELNTLGVVDRCGIRPVLIPDDFDEIIQNLKPGEDGVSEVLYGEYPQKTADIQEELDVACKSRKINQTGKGYTVPYSTGHREYKLLEYEYHDKKYVWKDNKWIEVTPIEWIVDEENKRLISKKVLLTDVPLNYDNETHNGDFETSSLYNFLNNQFTNEIMPIAGQPDLEITGINEVTSDGDKFMDFESETQARNIDEEIASLKAEIAQKKELIRECKESELEFLQAIKASLDVEIASLGIETNSAEKGQYVIKPGSNN